VSSEAVGRGKPPRATRFRKGQSGNPRGRPRNRRREIPYDYLLGQMVTIREDGRERRITAAEAFLLQLTKKGLEGCSASARSSLQVIENARATRSDLNGTGGLALRFVIRAFGLCSMFDNLGMGVVINAASKENARMKLKPWIVEAALARIAPKTFTVDEQRIVLKATHTPAKVHWPDWWTVQS